MYRFHLAEYRASKVSGTGVTEKADMDAYRVEYSCDDVAVVPVLHANCFSTLSRNVAAVSMSLQIYKTSFSTY